jgi:predicted amidohydrolase
MRLAAAQIRSLAGDIEANARRHTVLIDLAPSRDADLVFFPELSLTGYEPKLAGQLATDRDDPRLDVFQSPADDGPLTIGIGVPTVAPDGTRISLIVFRPHAPRLSYCKQQLHEDELPYFVPGQRQLVLEDGGHILAPAICYESLQETHAATAAELGADVYLASVAKPARDLDRAGAHYAAVARRHRMSVLMANGLGPSDDFVAAGRSAAWNDRGEMLGRLDEEREGIVIFDTLTREAGVLYV